MELSVVLAAVLALSVLVGVSLGVLGGGGSILTVPILVYVAGMDPKEAIASSLFVVGVTSAAGVISHARAGRVRWQTGVLFGASGLVGGFLGGMLGGHLPGDLLLFAFALMMLAASAAMIRGRRIDESKQQQELPVLRVVLIGLTVGLVASLVGAGGGFLVVPALALLGGLPMAVAVGTSMLVIAMNSLGGLAGYLSSVQLDWALVIAVTAAAVLGSVVGGRFVGRIPEAVLRKGFGWFVLVMGGVVLVEQSPPGLAIPAVAVVAAIALAAGACVKLAPSCPLRRSPTSSEELAGV
jgi:uncharacterized membrane protein YfcA